MWPDLEHALKSNRYQFIISTFKITRLIIISNSLDLASLRPLSPRRGYCLCPRGVRRRLAVRIRLPNNLESALINTTGKLDRQPTYAPIRFLSDKLVLERSTGRQIEGECPDRIGRGRKGDLRKELVTNHFMQNGRQVCLTAELVSHVPS